MKFVVQIKLKVRPFVIMANYRQARLAVDAFRGLASTIVTRPEPLSRGYFTTKPSSLASRPPKLPGFSPSNSILHNPIIPQKTQVRHYDAQAAQELIDWYARNWFWVSVVTPVTLGLGCLLVHPKVLLVVLGSFKIAKLGTYQTVPYTKRRHLVIEPSSDLVEETKMWFEEKKGSEYKGKLLAATHEECVRVGRIVKNIIDALKKDLNLEQGSESGVGKGRYGGVEYATSHLVGLDWEFLVLDEPITSAYCLPGIGKIVVYSGLLKHYGDDEVAFVIAHEVGHVVARHSAEWRVHFEMYLATVVGTLPADSAVAIRLLKASPFTRWRESEADHIGLLLMASAGYDPSGVPALLEEICKELDGVDTNPRNLITNPSGKERRETLAGVNIMEEAMAIYRDAKHRSAVLTA